MAKKQRWPNGEPLKALLKGKTQFAHANGQNSKTRMPMGKKHYRFIAFQLRKQWGVLDRQTGELIETAGNTERYPESWARTRADQMNEETENVNDKRNRL